MPLEFRCVFLCNTHSSPTRAKNPAKAPAYACELCIFLSCVHTSQGPHKLHAYIPVYCGKSPTVFSENRLKKMGILRIFSETPPEGICHGVILRNLIHSFVYFLFLSLSAPFPVISPGHPAISISFAPLYRIDYCCEATLKSPAINTGFSAE